MVLIPEREHGGSGRIRWTIYGEQFPYMVILVVSGVVVHYSVRVISDWVIFLDHDDDDDENDDGDEDDGDEDDDDDYYDDII